MLDVGGQLLAAVQPLAQAVFAVAHGRFQLGDGALGDFRGGDQLGNGGAQRLLVGLEQTKLVVEPYAIQDRQQKQDRDQALDQEPVMVAHCASMRFVGSSAFSNMANVVRGLRKALATRTATRSPTLPMRPSVSVMSAQRTVTIASGLSSSISVSPTFRFIICRNGSRASYSTASTPICAWPISVARWPSQIGSRPNFSPTNISSSVARGWWRVVGWVTRDM